MSQRTPAEAANGTTSQTETSQESSSSRPEPIDQPQRILHLRGRQNNEGRSVQWAEDVVDNEGLGRKSSKVCCIYHRPKAVDESSDESSSSDSDVSTDDEDAKRKGKGNKNDHDHAHDCEHGHGKSRGEGDGTNGKAKRKPSPNAYEKVPKPKNHGGKDGAARP